MRPISEEKEEFRVYNDPVRQNSRNNAKWTLNLIICCLVVATGSFQFGYNISSMNSVTTILNGFIRNDTFLFFQFHNKSQLFKLNEGYLIGNETKLNNSKAEFELRKQEYFESFFSLNVTLREILEERRRVREKEVREKFNMTIEEYLEYATKTLNEKKAKLESVRPLLDDGEKKVNKFTKVLWTITNCLFVIGGMIGTFSSKFIMDKAGRKAGIFIHHLFGITGGALALAAFFFHSPVSLMVSRFLFGVQGGMSCTLVPTYLAEISPAALRGRTGVIHQLCITIGIVVAQLLSLRQILGCLDLWGYLIAIPLIPALIGSISLLLFLPESPRALISKNRDEETVKKSLALLRNTQDVEQELEDLLSESKQGKNQSDENVSIIGLFKSRECRWAIITSLILHITQQLSGINAIFYYSSIIFKDAGISDEYIQYAILSTGVVNVITTIICVPLIDKLGRKPLLIYPMIFMLLDFVCLILLLTFKETNQLLSYLSIVCIMLFVMSFAIGLGPIPFIYTAECFRQNARSSAMALSTLMNWSAGLVLTLIFPFMLAVIQQYVFCVFAGVIAFAIVVILTKVPETKGKSIDKIIASFTKSNDGL